MSQFGNVACHKCYTMQSIVRANEDMIQEQIKIIKELQIDRQRLENAHNAVLGKLGTLQSQFLAFKEVRSSMVSITIQTQTPLLESKCRNSSSSLDEVSPTKQLLTKIQKGTNPKNSTKKINKENVGDFLKISKVREEQKSSRVRKYSMGDDVSSKEWIKTMQSMKSVTSAQFKQKTLHLLKRGIPHQLRKVIWPVVVQNQLAISDELYQELVKMREWIPEQVKSQIAKDIQRSFSGRTQYYSREGLREEISQILQIFHLYRPDVSYIQGMTYPVIILTLTVGKIKAFTIFSNLILANPFFRRLFTFEKYFPQCVGKTFEILLTEADEDIAKNLKDKNIDPQTFLVQWFFTIFSRSLSFEATLRFWDNLLYLGQITLFRLSVAILQLVGPRVIDTSYQQTIGLIQGFGGFGKQHKLLDSIMQNKISTEKVHRIMQKCHKELELLGLQK